MQNEVLHESLLDFKQRLGEHVVPSFAVGTEKISLEKNSLAEFAARKRQKKLNMFFPGRSSGKSTIRLALCESLRRPTEATPRAMERKCLQSKCPADRQGICLRLSKNYDFDFRN